MELIHAREIENSIVDLNIINKFKSYNCVLTEVAELDNNDFELELMPDHWRGYDIRKGDWIYIASTEWIGQVTRIQNPGDSVLIGGINARALMTKRVIPPSYNVSFGTYLNVDMELNKALRFLYEYNPNHALDSRHFNFSNNDTGINLKDTFRFEQYLKAVTKRLKNIRYRLQIEHIYSEGTKLLNVSAEPIVDYSEYEFFNEDSKVKITSKSDSSYEKKYLLCLGQGELANREVVVLMKHGNKISELSDLTSKEHSSFLCDTEIYDNSSAETRQELIKGGTERLLEQSLREEVNIDLNDELVYHLGDIIGGEDPVTGIRVKQSIIQKELTIGPDGEHITYKLGGL